MDYLNIEDLELGSIVLAEAVWYDDDDNEHTELHPYRITDISPNGSLVCDGSFDFRFIGEWLDDCDAEHIGDLMPMPLSEEFLTHNGYTDEGHYLSKDWSEGNILDPGRKSNYICLHKWDIKDGLKIFRCGIVLDNVCNYNRTIRFVHELQLALKSCDLRDMANSLSIPKTSANDSVTTNT